MRQMRERFNPIEAVFLYAAFTEHGFVKVGISTRPYMRVYNVHTGSPSPVMSAKWAWVGSFERGRAAERRIKREWASRNTRGEWYWFDYESDSDKAEFRSGLDGAFFAATGMEPTWKVLGEADMRAMANELLPTGLGGKRASR